ncbi:alpha/beta hydrolase [Citricoccus sp. NPDC055426]|uniref:alpha/beta fold hydrolase n=1 Tax=Citricoccus sp. NPDC055426 TaxID=3155536 RepID=UPI0034174C5F
MSPIAEVRSLPAPGGQPSLAHDVAGSGRPLLLLHSSAGDRRMWDPQWSGLLDSGYRVVRCDFRGYGQSPVPTGPGQDAQDVVDLLDTLGVGRTDVVGASYGGRVALELAAGWPTRVDALVLLCAGSPFHPSTEELDAFDDRETALIESGAIESAVELNVRTWLGPEADAGARDLVRRMQRRSYDLQLAAPEQFDPLPTQSELSHVRARTLVVTGRHDLTTFRRIGADLAARLPGARRVDLPWAGHLPSLERSDEILSLLVDFLEGLWCRRRPC